jgi:multicomponent Na+:H+ antiporter subunit G
MLTAPVAAHLIGRAAYCSKVTLWEKTWIDELANTCDWRVSEYNMEEKSTSDAQKSKT